MSEIREVLNEFKDYLKEQKRLQEEQRKTPIPRRLEEIEKVCISFNSFVENHNVQAKEREQNLINRVCLKLDEKLDNLPCNDHEKRITENAVFVKTAVNGISRNRRIIDGIKIGICIGLTVAFINWIAPLVMTQIWK